MMTTRAACLVLLALGSSAHADQPLAPPFAAAPRHAVTESQLDALQHLIDATPDSSPDKPDLLFRQAELYAELVRYYDSRAAAAPAGLQQDDYRHKQSAWLLASLKRYLDIADHPEKFGSYARNDEVLFYLAYLLTQVHKEEAARKYFKRLIHDYPRSRFIADAFLSFGDYYFDQRDFENALKFYAKVRQYPESRVYDYAHYKQAWAELRQGACPEARADFTAVAACKNELLAADARRQLESLAASGCP